MLLRIERKVQESLRRSGCSSLKMSSKLANDVFETLKVIRQENIFSFKLKGVSSSSLLEIQFLCPKSSYTSPKWNELLRSFVLVTSLLVAEKCNVSSVAEKCNALLAVLLLSVCYHKVLAQFFCNVKSFPNYHCYCA